VFAEGKERDRALGIWAAITAGGAALGLILGGVLTEYLDWRWVFYVNVPIAVLAVVGALAYVPESRDESARGFDVAGRRPGHRRAHVARLRLVQVNDDGSARAPRRRTSCSPRPCSPPSSWCSCAAAARSCPFRLFRSRSLLGRRRRRAVHRRRHLRHLLLPHAVDAGAQRLQPIRAGLAFLPMTCSSARSPASLAAARPGRPAPLLLVGPLLAGAGLLHLSLRLEPDSSYVGVVLPSLALVAAGMGLAFVALTSAAVAGVPSADAGIASALLNAGQQVGGALGLAVLTAVSTSRTADLLPAGTGGLEALQPVPGQAPDPAFIAQVFNAVNDGWALGFGVAAAFLAAAALVAASLVKVSKEDAAKALKEGAATAG
jgi:MFS family permease